jgi:hypothetical protein
MPSKMWSHPTINGGVRVNRRAFLQSCMGSIAITGFGALHCTSNPVGGENGSVNFFLLKDANLTFEDVLDEEPTSLELQEEPWISNDDLLMYDSSTHMVYLNRTTSDLLPDIMTEQVSTSGIPFAACVSGVACYVGGMIPMYSSWGAIDRPVIMIPSIRPSDVLYLSNGLYVHQSVVDLRNDSRVLEALNTQGILHRGIRCEMLSVNVERDGGASMVTYEYQIFNDDMDDLYVLDPDRMGTEIFHYYTNGPSFNNGQRSYQSLNQTIEKSGSLNAWEIDWFTRIPSGGHIQRTTAIDGYDEIPPGAYHMLYIFPSPSRIDKIDREQTDGRIWLGEILVRQEIEIST